MPKQHKPITERSRVEDESTGHGTEHHGLHRQDDESLPGKGSRKGGLNRQAGGGTAGTAQNQGRPRGSSSKPRGQRKS